MYMKIENKNNVGSCCFSMGLLLYALYPLVFDNDPLFWIATGLIFVFFISGIVFKILAFRENRENLLLIISGESYFSVIDSFICAFGLALSYYFDSSSIGVWAVLLGVSVLSFLFEIKK